MKTIASLIVFLSISISAFCQYYYSNTCNDCQQRQYGQQRPPEFSTQNYQPAPAYYNSGNANQRYYVQNEKYTAQVDFNQQTYDINCANNYNRVLQNTVCKPESNYYPQQYEYSNYNMYSTSEPSYYYYPTGKTVGEKYIDSGQYEESMVYMR